MSENEQAVEPRVAGGGFVADHAHGAQGAEEGEYGGGSDSPGHELVDEEYRGEADTDDVAAAHAGRPDEVVEVPAPAAGGEAETGEPHDGEDGEKGDGA